jgi:hypothetical protein
MKLVSALVGLAALGGVALSTGAVSAQPIDVPSASGVVPSGYICNEWGHCWHLHYNGGGYYHPHYWGGYGWPRHWGGGYGWHHWHHWHQW